MAYYDENTFDITQAELDGANRGQRPDLLSDPKAIYRLPNGTLYQLNAGQLTTDVTQPALLRSVNGTSAVVVGGDVVPPGKLAGAAGPDAILTKDGRMLAQLTNPLQSAGVTSLTQSITNDRPRFSPYRRKVVISGAGTNEIRLASLNSAAGFTCDVDDPAFSIDMYIDQLPDIYAQSPNHLLIQVIVSNDSPYTGANYRLYVFDASYIRQGENTFKFRKGDVNNTKTAGNMGLGSSFSDTGTGLNFDAPIKYIGIQFLRMDGHTVHIGDVRQPARAKPIFVIGFDANLPIMESHVAPLFARYGIKSYTTFTGIYEEASRGDAWDRMKRLQTDYGWDIINHTWNHGATSAGRNQGITLSRAGTVVTGTMASGHGIPLNTYFKGRIVGATNTLLNGVFDMYATGTTTITYSTVSSGTIASESTAFIRTMLDAIIDSDTAENRRIAKYEIGTTVDALRGLGLNRQSGCIIWPNNSVPELTVTADVCKEYGIVVGRGMRRGYTSVNELGIDNPLHCGSQDMDSGLTSYTRLSGMKARVIGAKDRGEHCWIYGHYLQLMEEAGGTVAIDYPPGQGGNPAPPAGALSGAGGWWYYEMLEDLIVTTIGPMVAAGEALVMSPSEYARYMGLTRG
jgi:hypothetical protein